MRYFITFSCYGAHLHGEEMGSVDRRHNMHRGRLLAPDPPLAATERKRMDEGRYLLDAESRNVVLRAIRETCSHRGWELLAAHVRTNHVHVVVEAEVQPEKVMNHLKAWASRALNQIEGEGSHRKRWARHGRTRWLWKDDDVRSAIQYVVDEQGVPMAVFVSDEI